MNLAPSRTLVRTRALPRQQPHHQQNGTPASAIAIGLPRALLASSPQWIGQTGRSGQTGGERMASNEYFATVAEQWDALRAGYFPQAVRDKALAAAGAQAGRTAADLGAGTGFVTKALLDAGLTVFAVDQSPAMLAELRAKFPAADQARYLHVIEAAADRLPLPDASVDCAFANMLLHHVDEPARAIAEMARILKPGGRLVITDLDLHARRELLDEQHDRWPGFARGDVARWLESAGLAAIAVDACGERCCADSVCSASPVADCASADCGSAVPASAGSACCTSADCTSSASDSAAVCCAAPARASSNVASARADCGSSALAAAATPVADCSSAASANVDSVRCASRAGVSIFLACGRKPILGIHPCQADADAVGRRARALFDASPNLLCAESVFLALAEGLGVESPLVPRLATGFCSGLARTDGLCGAFSGGVLGLGLALGRDTGQDGLDRAYAVVQEFRQIFMGRFGGDACTRICGCRLDTDEGRLAFGPSGAKARCLDVVEWAAAQAIRILRNA